MGGEGIPKNPKPWLWKNSLDFPKEFWGHGLEIPVCAEWENPVCAGWIPSIPLCTELGLVWLQSQAVSRE